MASPTAAQCHTLISYYETKYKEKYGTAPNLNRVTARWNFDSVLRSMGAPQVKELIDYYFTTPPTKRHELDWFFYNYDKLRSAFIDAQEDREYRAKLMEESKIRAERWRQSGKRGIADNKRGTEE